MKIHHLSAGTLCPLSPRLVSGEGSYFGRGCMVCHCWIIESAHGLILVDTGLGTRDLADPKGRLGAAFTAVTAPVLDEAGTALRQVERLGFRASDVRHIIPTHLDLDHAGGISDFPEATVHIFAKEYEAATRPATLPERNRYRAVHWAHGPSWDRRSVEGEAWFGFPTVQALDAEAEVLLIPLHGHTRGHVGVAARGEGGRWFLHAGDAYFHHGEMKATYSCPSGLRAFQRIVAIDDTQRRQNQARLRELALGHPEVTVHSAHCPVEFEALSTLR